jgi:hypothetical protein
MRSELHRNQVTDAQTVDENLRDAAYHEAGHVVVARFLGLTVREVEIEEDGSGRADISPGEHFHSWGGDRLAAGRVVGISLDFMDRPANVSANSGMK